MNRAPVTREAYYYSRYYRPEYAAYLSPDGPTAEGHASAAATGPVAVQKPRPVLARGPAAKPGPGNPPSAASPEAVASR